MSRPYQTHLIRATRELGSCMRVSEFCFGDSVTVMFVQQTRLKMGKICLATYFGSSFLIQYSLAKPLVEFCTVQFHKKVVFFFVLRPILFCFDQATCVDWEQLLNCRYFYFLRNFAFGL